MALAAGTRLGPYEILAPLGVGGMGEVYRARDTRLDRAVAIKVLPTQFSSDPVRKQRFEREAKTVSHLNHPHICALYDVGNQDGVDYLVMECVEGETLAKRLEKGALPLDQVLKFGAQIADALDKAHRSGTVHRDLKPGNIMLTPGGAKLLDFGLAKPAAPLITGATLTAATQPPPVTQEGTVVGTFQFMSPEQIEGKELDGRSDIFSLGAVLYEMLTGERAFQGKSQLSVASAILEKEPVPISSIKPPTPPALDHAIRRCLAKDAEERWQTARDLALELKWIAESSAQAGLQSLSAGRSKNYNRLSWILVAILFAAVLVLSLVFFQRAPTSPAPVRFLVLAPENSHINAQALAAVSPDGRYLAFVAPDATGKDVLWVRSFDSLTAHSLGGTAGAEFPFWSPDSRWIGFFADGNTLKKIDLTGGPAISVAGAIAGNSGAWNRNGVIMFRKGSTRSLYRVPAAGGVAVPITKQEEAVAGGRHELYFLPDGIHYLFSSGLTGTGSAVYVGSLDSDTSKLLVQDGASPVYAQGYLLYLLGSTLMAQPFDEKRLETLGAASPLAEQVQSFSASQAGTVLAYWTGVVPDNPQLIWFDRTGRRMGSLGDPASQLNIEISPDGTKVASELYDSRIWVSGTNSDIWLYDVSRGVRTRLTSGPGSRRGPCWSPDGKHIAYSSNRKGHFDLYEKTIDGAGNDELLLESEVEKSCWSWSPDSKFLLFMTYSGESKRQLWTLPLFGDRKPVPYLPSEFDETLGKFSPDGKWIAYQSDESGRMEVYVSPFPASGGKLLVSIAGGTRPTWRRDGKEIFYFAPNDKLMAAKVKQNGSTLEIGVATPLFQAHPESFLHSYDVSADGQHFLIVTSEPQKQPSPITVVLNWTAELRKK